MSAWGCICLEIYSKRRLLIQGHYGCCNGWNSKYTYCIAHEKIVGLNKLFSSYSTLLLSIQCQLKQYIHYKIHTNIHDCSIAICLHENRGREVFIMGRLILDFWGLYQYLGVKKSNNDAHWVGRFTAQKSTCWLKQTLFLNYFKPSLAFLFSNFYLSADMIWYLQQPNISRYTGPANSLV